MTSHTITARHVGLAVALTLLMALAVPGALTVSRWCFKRCQAARMARQLPAVDPSDATGIPLSKLPGPPRPMSRPDFILTPTNAQVMIGMDDPGAERFRDISGNDYATPFIADFSYERPCRRQPQVLVLIEPRDETFRGRLEAHRLKPNFAYQIKLRGVYADRVGFETIGRTGRWRLPGRGTNYTDEDYAVYPDKANVEAYVLFDYFVTDRHGNAVRDFALDSSLHVLWNAARQNGLPVENDLYRVVTVAADAAVYSRPKREASVEWLWAEREVTRYRTAGEKIRLPPGPYLAELVLTEESFHSLENDGGFWATVYRCPVQFTITPPTAPSPPLTAAERSSAAP